MEVQELTWKVCRRSKKRNLDVLSLKVILTLCKCFDIISGRREISKNPQFSIMSDDEWRNACSSAFSTETSVAIEFEVNIPSTKL